MESPTGMANRVGDNDGTPTITQTEIIPKVLLPSLYRTIGGTLAGAGQAWQLCCFVRNVSGGDLYPLVHLTVEVALLPNYNDERNALMGGAFSSGTKKTY